jgi:hypothetical protein
MLAAVTYVYETFGLGVFVVAAPVLGIGLLMLGSWLLSLIFP